MKKPDNVNRLHIEDGFVYGLLREGCVKNKSFIYKNLLVLFLLRQPFLWVSVFIRVESITCPKEKQA